MGKREETGRQRDGGADGGFERTVELQVWEGGGVGTGRRRQKLKYRGKKGDAEGITR